MTKLTEREKELFEKFPRLVKLENVTAPAPYLAGGEVAESFNNLRQHVRHAVGYDFLGTLSDCYRFENFKTSKYGVAFNSVHKTGRAFDYNIPSNKYLLVPEKTNANRTVFRTYLQVDVDNVFPDDTPTVLREVIRPYYVTHDKLVERWLGGSITQFTLKSDRWFDFTGLAEREFAWMRIPMWQSVSLRTKWSNALEFWHYQRMYEGGTQLNFQSALALLRKPLNDNFIPHVQHIILRYGDTGASVTALQRALVNKGFLRESEVDGIFRKITLGAVTAFQLDNGLKPDGIVGRNTFDALGI